METGNGNGKWKREMETGNGNGKWKREIETGNRNGKWKREGNSLVLELDQNPQMLSRLFL
jgi:hypothetical protein